MELSKAKELLLNRSNAFHERYFIGYGQMIQRLDGDTYLMSRPNLRLAKLTSKDFDVYDINTGDIGSLFRSLKNVNAMVVLTTEASVRFSSNHQRMRPALDDLAQIIGPDVLVAPDGSAKELLKVLKNRRGCFIKGGGILAVGQDIEEAIAGARILEKSAEAEMFAEKVGGLKYLDAGQAQTLSSFYDATYSKINKTGQVDYTSKSGGDEFRLRNQIIEIGKKMAWSDLVQGSWGNISARLDEHHMLITPSGMDYFNIRVEDIVRVDLETLEYGRQRKPSSECLLHATLYRENPECNAVIHSHSNGISVFSAAHAGFRIDNPEMNKIIGDLHCSEYQTPGTEALCQSVLKALEGSHACIIANHGALFYSHNLELALAIADATESRACNLLNFRTTIHDREDEEDTSSDI